MKSVRLIATLLCATLLASSAWLRAESTRAEAEKDPVFKAMLTELDRSMSKLQLPGFAKPYFIQYRIEDVDEFTARAEYGASEGSFRARQRVALVTVRVGDRKIDNSSSSGDGAIQLSPFGEDSVSLRSALWTATDQAYKAALAAYAQKQAELKQVQTPPQANDFSEEKPLISLGDPARLELGSSQWEERMAHASGLYRGSEAEKLAGGEINYSNTQFDARATTTWIVTSEGTIVRKAASRYQQVFAAGAQAADGMRIDRAYASTGAALADLDAQEPFEKHALELIGALGKLRNAPLVEEEYHGPVLLSGDAAADTLRALLANSVIAVRPKLGTEARTDGAFASSLRAQVLPAFLDVVDDPTLKSYDGKGLVGAYDVDDEGVAAQAVKLITAGRLENYLIGRQPVRDFPHSNGHGRGSNSTMPKPSTGVLKITARQGFSNDELSKKLVDAIKDRGLANAYFVETLGNVQDPRLLYRVGPDGSRTLVRGAKLTDIDQRALRSNLEAAGRDLFVSNYADDVPDTVLAPSLLFSDATIRRANEKNERLPFYPQPK